MIPYLPPEYTTLLNFGTITLPLVGRVGPIEVHLFGVLVAIGILVGARLTGYRGRQLGLSDDQVSSLTTWIVLMGFVIAHVFDVIAYTPRQLFERSPMQAIALLLNVPAGISSFGGFLGALLAMIYWARRERVRVLVCADSLLFGLSFGWLFGRLGCFSAHDHPGAFTRFFLAVNYPEGPRHDLGLDEALYAAVLAGSFVVIAARRIPPLGTYAAIACLTYGPVRFALDFLRATDTPTADPRYFGLTPAQYGCLAVFATGVALLMRALAERGKPLPGPAPTAPAPAPTTTAARRRARGSS